MVPISEYATVPKGSTLFQAIAALEKAQEEFTGNQYQHRAILILDNKQQVIGKLSQTDALRALEPKDVDLKEINKLSQYGFSAQLIRQLQTSKRLKKGTPLTELCANAVRLKVEDFMQAPTEGEYVDHETSLDIAIQQLVLGNHLALLVTRNQKIVGILRLTDVFAAVFHAMQECHNVTN
ncbi:MAG: CBS domain-containing protein [Desulfatitalea sp.]|nr:CBS domain-containing protein [Desulfatitalea sp.]NNK01244.1 CBS domain-containing protein [Desulfatitalea sp.]